MDVLAVTMAKRKSLMTYAKNILTAQSYAWFRNKINIISTSIMQGNFEQEKEVDIYNLYNNLEEFVRLYTSSKSAALLLTLNITLYQLGLEDSLDEVLSLSEVTDAFEIESKEELSKDLISEIDIAVSHEIFVRKFIGLKNQTVIPFGGVNSLQMLRLKEYGGNDA